MIYTLKHNRILIKNLKDARNKIIVKESLNKLNKEKKNLKQQEQLINEKVKTVMYTNKRRLKHNNTKKQQ